MDPTREINEVVARFVERMASLARELTYRQLVDTLDAAPVPAVPPPGGRRAPAPPAPAHARAAGRRRAVGGRRTPEEIERLRERLLAHIRAQPGQRIEQIKVALGATTPELAVPLQKLIYADLVRTEGDRRATRYFATERDAAILPPASDDADASAA